MKQKKNLITVACMLKDTIKLRSCIMVGVRPLTRK